MEFYDLTLRELFRELVVAKRRMRRDDERDTVLAWMIGLRSGQGFAGKLPDLKKVLAPRPEPVARERTRTDRDLTVLHMLSARYGIPLRKTRLRRVS